MKSFFFFVIVFFSYSLYSQGIKNVEHTSQNWLTFSGKFKVSNQLGLMAESTVRSMDHSVNKASQTLVLVGLSWSVNDFIKLAAGYQHISVLPAFSNITVTQPEYRRSSSMGTRRNRLMRKGRAKTNDNDKRYGNDVALTKNLAHIEMIKGLPPEIMKNLQLLKGPMYGVWLIDHPLQIHPGTQIDMLNAIHDSAISNSKKLEWVLDVLREYDEKRKLRRTDGRTDLPGCSASRE
jgi:hypothetical protein